MLEAFAVALQEVDELRNAAENVSMELTKIKEEQHMDKHITKTRKTLDEYVRDSLNLLKYWKE